MGHGDEPRHCRAVERFAWACIVLAIGQAAVCLMLVVAAVVSSGHEPLGPPLWRVPWSLGAMVGVVLPSTALLLIVDMARDVRAIRNAGEK
jgi:hypothetical protein